MLSTCPSGWDMKVMVETRAPDWTQKQKLYVKDGRASLPAQKHLPLDYVKEI